MQALNIQTLNQNNLTSEPKQGSSVSRLEKSFSSDTNRSFKSMLERVAQDKAKDGSDKSLNNTKEKKLSQKIKGQSAEPKSQIQDNSDVTDNQAIDFVVGNQVVENTITNNIEEIPNNSDISVEIEDLGNSEALESLQLSQNQIDYLLQDSNIAYSQTVNLDDNQLLQEQMIVPDQQSDVVAAPESFEAMLNQLEAVADVSENTKLPVEKQDITVDSIANVLNQDSEITEYAENVSQSSLDMDMKNTDSTVKKTKKSLFTVEDLRTQPEAEAIADSKLKVEETKESLETHIEVENKNTVDMTVTLSNNAQQDIASLTDQSAAADGSTFQQMLSAQIQENAPEFVKAGNIVLRDNNNGTINMNLKPESLGNVKISLELSDKVITGQITVASKEAYEAFKQNLETLKQAFVENGFENATFNLNLAENSSNGFLGQNQQQPANEEYFSKQTYKNYVSDIDDVESVEQYSDAYTRSSNHSIDVVA